MNKTCLKYFCKIGWRNPYVIFGTLTLLIATTLTVAYYLNHPAVELTFDTSTYLSAAQQLQTSSNPVNPLRLPTYPLLIVIVYDLAGQGNLMALSIVQGALFVLSAVEFYALAALLFRRSWLAFLLGLLISTNIILLSFSKPIMSEGSALWLLTTLILLTIIFARTQRPRVLITAMIFLGLLCFTRSEWEFLPLLLAGYLLFGLIQREARKRFFKQLLISVALIYALLGGYVAVNAFTHDLVGLTYIENMNSLGKVLQYNMYMEAPAEYQYISHRLDPYVKKGTLSPYVILHTEKDLASDNAKLAGEFARAIIISHPFEFIGKSVPYFFSSLTTYFPVDELHKFTGPLATPLSWLFAIHRAIYALNSIFPYCTLFWFGLLAWKRTRDLTGVREMALIAAIACCAMVITTLGGYFEHDYMRVHIVFDPLILLTIWSVPAFIVSKWPFRQRQHHTTFSRMPAESATP